MVVDRRSLLLSSTAALLAPPAAAQAWPARPVHIVEGYGAGGAPDIIARLSGKWLSERLGKPFVIENKPGASGRIATEYVAKAAPDGYTLLQILNNNTVDAAIKERLPYDFIRDIAPVAGVYRQPLVLEVHPSVPANTVAEFIALAKERPGKINLASAGVGTGTHIAAEMFQMMAGVSLFHIPYKGVQALRDVVAGQVHVYFGVVASSLPQIKAGKLRALAVTTASRSPVLPDVPAMAEFLPGYEFSAWYGLGAPRGTPDDIVQRLNREVNAALADSEFARQLTDLGGLPLGGSVADFQALIAADTEKIAGVIKAANITIE
ncbi:MAG TPA: tripartite tricarboxylate transporter substrate binding protein [Reyranella sp.]|nr:tripartite tricarboxylate transporter substrate binding protein [Reyranella sp.]